MNNPAIKISGALNIPAHLHHWNKFFLRDHTGGVLQCKDCGELRFLNVQQSGIFQSFIEEGIPTEEIVIE